MLLRRVAILTALMLALSGAAAYAIPQPLPEQVVAQRPGRGNRGPQGGEQRWIQQLNLTPEQQQDIEGIRDRYQNQMTQRREQMQQAMSELRQMMSANASDRDLRSKHNDIMQMRQEMGEMRFEQMLAIRKVLTPEQREQFAQFMQERRSNRGNPSGNRPGNRPGNPR